MSRPMSSTWIGATYQNHRSRKNKVTPLDAARRHEHTRPMNVASRSSFKSGATQRRYQGRGADAASSMMSRWDACDLPGLASDRSIEVVCRVAACSATQALEAEPLVSVDPWTDEVTASRNTRFRVYHFCRRSALASKAK